MNTLEKIAERHPLTTYFVLAIAISWGSVLLVIGGLAGLPGTKAETDRLFPFAYLAMLAGPSLAGILAILLTQGKAGILGLCSRLARWRVGPLWYAVALLTAPVLTTVVLLSLSRLSNEFVPGVFTTSDKMPLLLYGLIVALGAGLFEELGWTGFATPRLRGRHGVLAGGLLLGMVWGGWHILVNLWASSTPNGEISPVFMLPVLLSTLGLGMLPAYRVLMVWVYDRTGSLLLGILMHVSLTASLIILRPAAGGMGLVVYELTWAGALWAAMAMLGPWTRRGAIQRRIGDARTTPLFDRIRATRAEKERPLAGDDLIHDPIASLTHAITILRPPRDVWPWIAQMGAGSRAGWYSYDFVDNGGRPSANLIKPEFQRLEVGLIFPALPGRMDAFTLLAFEPERYLVLGALPNGSLLMTWAFALEPIGEDSTRLITRARGARNYQFKHLPKWLTRSVVPVVHHVMERRQLLNIAGRAEASWPTHEVAGA